MTAHCAKAMSLLELPVLCHRLHRSPKAWWAQHRAQRWFMCTGLIAAFWLFSCLGCWSPEKLLLQWKPGKAKVFTWEMKSDCICMGNLHYMAKVSNLALTPLLVGAFSQWLLGLKVTLDSGKGHKRRLVTAHSHLHSPPQESFFTTKPQTRPLELISNMLSLCSISASSLLTATSPTSSIFPSASWLESGAACLVERDVLPFFV